MPDCDRIGIDPVWLNKVSDQLRIAVLTGGGDAPGLNGVIESCCRSLLKHNVQVIGIEDGFEGVFHGRYRNITHTDLEGLHAKAGTLLGTSNRSRIDGREEEFRTAFNKLGCVGLIAAGGDGTFDALSKLGPKFNLIGVPKTIDNDLHGTDLTFGFDTAISVVAESIDALKATADAHRRVFFIETMGRSAGWIALGGGLAGYADGVLIPERPFLFDNLFSFIREKGKQGSRGLVFAVSEAATAVNEAPRVAHRVANSPVSERYGGIAEELARRVESVCQWESRHVVLGHLQRSRIPTTMDRFLTLNMGLLAAKLARNGAWGQAVCWRNGAVTSAPIEDFMKGARRVPSEHPWVLAAQELGIFV